MDELLVIIGAELILLASIVAMMVYGRRADVLSGRYFDEADRPVRPRSRMIKRLQRSITRNRVQRRARAALTAALAAVKPQRPAPSRDKQGQPQDSAAP